MLRPIHTGYLEYAVREINNKEKISNNNNALQIKRYIRTNVCVFTLVVVHSESFV